MCISRFKHFPIVLCNLFQRAWLSLEQDSTNARFYRQAALTQQHAGWMRTGKHSANAPTSTKETEYVAAWRMGPVAPKRSKRVLKGASASGIFASATRPRVWLTKKLLRYKLGTSISALTNVYFQIFRYAHKQEAIFFRFRQKMNWKLFSTTLPHSWSIKIQCGLGSLTRCLKVDLITLNP